MTKNSKVNELIDTEGKLFQTLFMKYIINTMSQQERQQPLRNLLEQLEQNLTVNNKNVIYKDNSADELFETQQHERAARQL